MDTAVCLRLIILRDGNSGRSQLHTYTYSRCPGLSCIIIFTLTISVQCTRTMTSQSQVAFQFTFMKCHHTSMNKYQGEILFLGFPVNAVILMFEILSFYILFVGSQYFQQIKCRKNVFCIFTYTT